MSWGPPLVSHEEEKLLIDPPATTIFSRDRPRVSSRASLLASFSSLAEISGSSINLAQMDQSQSRADHESLSNESSRTDGTTLRYTARKMLNTQVEWRITFLPKTLFRVSSMMSVGELSPLLSPDLVGCSVSRGSSRQSDPDSSRGYNRDRVSKSTVIRQTMTNMLAAFFSTSVLIMPYSFYAGGWAAVLTLMVATLLYTYTATLLTSILRSQNTTDSYLGTILNVLGQTGAIISSLFSWLLVLIFLIELIFVGGSLLCHIVPNVVPCWLLHLGVVFLYLPTIFVVQFGGLYGLTLLTFLYHVMLLCCLLLVGVTSGPGSGQSLMHPAVGSDNLLTDFWGVLLAFLFQLHGLHAHFVYPECWHSLVELYHKKGDEHNVNTKIPTMLTVGSFSTVFVLYLIMGIVGYLMFGSSTTPNFAISIRFLDFSAEGLDISSRISSAVCILMAVTIIGTFLLKFGIFMNTCATALEEVEELFYASLLDKWRKIFKHENQRGEGDPHPSFGAYEEDWALPPSFIACNRVVLLLVCLLISLWLNTFARIVLLGGACTLPIAVIIPCLAFNKEFHTTAKRSQLAFNYLIAVVGAVLMGLAVYSALVFDFPNAVFK